MNFPCLALLLALSCPVLVFAETISLDEVAAKVRTDNPTLRAARLRIQEAKGRLLGAGRLANPEVGLEIRRDRMRQEGNVIFSIDQKLPITARLALEKYLSATLVTTAELEVRDMERTLIAEAQAIAVRLLSLEQQRALRNQQTALAENLSKFIAGRAGVGELSALDATQAQLDTQRLALEARKLETERVALIGELRPRLGVSAGEILTVTGALPAAVIPALVSGEHRPDYQRARVNESAARTEIDLAVANKWGDVSVGGFMEGERSEDAPDGFATKPFVGLRVSIPFPLWNKNEGEIAEKTAAARRARLETEALVSTIQNEAGAALAEMEANANIAGETRDKLLPLVQKQAENLEKAYGLGQADLLTVLRVREQRLQLESAVIESTRDFHLARIRYEAATGQHAPAVPVRPGKASRAVAVPDVAGASLGTAGLDNRLDIPKIKSKITGKIKSILPTVKRKR